MIRILPSHTCRSIATSLLGLLLMTLTSCKEKESVVEPPAPEKKFEGILVVYENGVAGGTIGDASDDWQDIPEAGVKFGPACPNPVLVSSDSSMSRTDVLITLPRRDSLKLWLESSPGVLDMVISEGIYEAGVHAMRVNLAGKKAGVYRVYMRVYRDKATYTSYGDIMLGP